MFFETERLPLVQAMIIADTDDRSGARPSAELLPLQRADFEGLFRAMDGLPVIIRLIDPPLHEFLPDHDELLKQVTELETRSRSRLAGEVDAMLGRLRNDERPARAVQALRESNPMLGPARVRLAIHMPGDRADAGAGDLRGGVRRAPRRRRGPCPKIMIPLVSHVNELHRGAARSLEAEAQGGVRASKSGRSLTSSAR